MPAYNTYGRGAITPLSGVFVARSKRPTHSQPRGTRAVVEEFIELMYRRQLVSQAFDQCVSSALFTEHGRGLPAKLDDAIGALREKFASPAFSVRLLNLAVDGGMAMLHLAVEDSVSGQASSRVEVFRVEQGWIVEHWCVSEPADPHFPQKDVP
jgi:predicted SnoaL-like aldol condensation-catalyzing enzyme